MSHRAAAGQVLAEIIARIYAQLAAAGVQVDGAPITQPPEIGELVGRFVEHVVSA